MFVLAEPTLERFSQRIADDLPDDLAVLSQVQMPAIPSGSTSGWTGAASDAGGIDGNIGSESGQALGAGLGGVYSLGDFAAEPSYQISFSQHYRQLLLACF